MNDKTGFSLFQYLSKRRSAGLKRHIEAYRNEHPSYNTSTLNPLELYNYSLSEYHNFHNTLEESENPVDLTKGSGAFETYPPILTAARKSLELQSQNYYGQPDVDEYTETLLAQFLHREGIVPVETNIDYLNLLIGAGTTHLFDLYIEKLFNLDSRPLWDKGVMVTISPGYGLFCKQIFDQGGEIEVIEVDENTGWKMTPEMLEDNIQRINKNLGERYRKKVIAHYHMFLSEAEDFGWDIEIFPTMNPKETSIDSINIILNQANKIVAELIFQDELLSQSTQLTSKRQILQPPVFPRVIGLFFSNPHNPLGVIYDQNEVNMLDKVRRQYDIHVIEDLVHRDIEERGQIFA